MAQRPPRVPHSGDAKKVRAQQQIDAARAELQAQQAAEAAARVDPDEVLTGALPVIPAKNESSFAARASRTARKAGNAVGDGVRKAKDAVAQEVEADLAGEHLPGGTRRKRKQDPEDRQRRLVERVALEGAIRDPGEPVKPRVEHQRPVASAPVPARALSTRVIALSVIFIVSGFMLFPAITTYVRQRAELGAAQAVITQEKATKQALTDEVQRWDDPNYVGQQARERIQRYLPGEKSYVVVNPPAASTEETADPVNPGEYRQGLPWGDGLWDSVLRSSTP